MKSDTKINKVLFVIVSIMLLVIIFAMANKVGVFESNKTDTSVNDNVHKTLENTGGGDIRNTGNKKNTNKVAVKEIDEYGIGEVAFCMYSKDRKMEYMVNDVYLIERIEDIPEKLKGDVCFIGAEGYPKDENKKLLVADVTMKNISEAEFEHYINCVEIVQRENREKLISTIVGYGNWEDYIRKDYYKAVLKPDEEFRAKLIFIVNEEVFNNSDVTDFTGLELIVNPKGMSSTYYGAAVFNLDAV